MVLGGRIARTLTSWMALELVLGIILTAMYSDVFLATPVGVYESGRWCWAVFPNAITTILVFA